MDCSKKTAAVKVMLSALIFIGMSIKLTSSRLCDGDWNGYCNLKGVSIRKDTEASNFEFPNEKGIRFEDANISSSAKILFGRIPDGTEAMVIDGGHVPEVYIKQTIFMIHVFHYSKLQAVIIDQAGTYKLKKLIIWNSLLRSIPKNISKLTNLENLDLSYNKIETVSMDHFKDLLNMTHLKLSHNSIVRVDTTVPLNLPKLEELHLFDNNLQYVSIVFWNFPNLRTFGASSNKLRNIINFPRQFPKLEWALIKDNQWSCAWLEPVKSELSKILKSREECSGKSINNICCQDYSIDDNSFAYFEERMAFGFLQINENLQKAIQQIDEKISKLATDTTVLIDNKISTVGRTIQGIKDDVKSVESSVKKQVEELQRNMGKDRKHFLQASENLQKGIDHTSESVSKLATETQAKVKSMESSIRTEIHQEITQITAKVDGNRASISESISKLTTDTKELIDNQMSDVTRTVQESRDEIKLTQSSVREQNQKLENLSVRVDENRASAVDDRKLLEEKISNSDNQNKEEFKRVQQNLNENRALINDVVEDLYLEELEKEEL